VPTSNTRLYERALVYLAVSVGLMLLGPGPAPSTRCSSREGLGRRREEGVAEDPRRV